MNITSNDDESVTLKVGSITALIDGDSWRDANRAARLLGALLDGERAAYDQLRVLELISGQMRLVEATMSRLLTEIKEALERLEP